MVSDGIYNLLEDEPIVEVLKSYEGKDMDEMGAKIVEKAVELQGGIIKDDISVISCLLI